ncbi:bifunctional (p)ppGpp synthetase/guanosine-3',5'-bis(diphosphate) 3'-pyrophosphohydrolase [Hydrogenoanaerobacterium sp.]|uniref:RelA/SpoT family protein n=1 Tax=Hydrogenoanaerobacterium sp. TaxID=2953763 RepID=UPI00289BD307|nr:bifunctional (p)ppGpp synthetase/guanosine-3',5'-bis(diphosphate) 3'-pyrophosphohydrolase [Hydrogenoanaerobacterium sp.]
MSDRDKSEIEAFEGLLATIEKTGKQYDVECIARAYETAKEAHKGQRRVSGEPYVMHPVHVAEILVQLGMDTDTIVAALLHDVVEDTSMTLEMLEKQYGKDVALLVDGVTKLGKIPFSSREEQQAENVRKMLLAMAKDVRVIIIKLADRLHNMRTISVMPDQKRRDKSLETMEVYAPLAHRLGIRAVKEELEDIALKYLDPIAYEEIEHMLDLKKDERSQFIEHIKARINQRVVEEDGKKIHLEGRVKSIYGIYRKVYMNGRSMDEIYDIYAVRVIVDTVIECYNILGIVHDMFRPIPNRFKDYISTPKPNMYQSLHTTVIDKEGIPFEIQIRTWDMHYTAEYGIAAHWKYKAGVSGKDKLEERLAWVRQLLEVQQESEDIEDIVRSIKTDLAPEEVFVFTPRGDVICLPAGAIVIDFAYAIHTAVGNRMVGAKVDGRMVSIDYQVKTGNIVEVLTSKSLTQGPSRDWLKLVKTSEARNKIRSWFKKERRDENIAEGKTELEREFRRNYINLPDAEMKEFISSIAKRQHFPSIEDFMAAIGYGGISLSRIMPRIKDDFQRTYRAPEVDPKTIVKPKKDKKGQSGVIVEGLDSCLVKFARCCNPLPGDDIVGFVTRGFGVSIHKRDCVNVLASMQDEAQRDRWVRTHWAESVKETFKSTIEIYATDRQGLIADISIALANMHIQMHSLNAREAKDSHVVIQITLGISGVDQLSNIINTFGKISGVISVERATQ